MNGSVGCRSPALARAGCPSEPREEPDLETRHSETPHMIQDLPVARALEEVPNHHVAAEICEQAGSGCRTAHGCKDGGTEPVKELI